MLSRAVFTIALAVVLAPLASGALPLPASQDRVPLGAPEPVYARAAENHGFEVCGDGSLVLIFKNPDLRPQSDGLIHASGWFFIQFQAIGEKALDIEKLAFSFGKAIPAEARRCDLPAETPFTGAHNTGAYIFKYRADDDPADGFFVPINTTNVPDGEYAAALSAFDAAGNELVRYYAHATVANGCVPDCRLVQPDPTKDLVKPWPIVLPGDGEQREGTSGLTVEFAEELREPPIVQIKRRGADAYEIVPIEEGEPRVYDDDAVPDNSIDPSPIKKRSWGKLYQSTIRIEENDIIRVRATDLNGNFAEKILHIGDPTIGGRIVLAFPDVAITGDGQQKTADEFGTAVYPFSFANTGNGTLHGNLLLDVLPEGLRARFDNDHPITAAGGVHHANLTVRALDTLAPGTYDVTGEVRYQSGGQEVAKRFAVKFTLAAKSNVTAAEEDKVLEGARPAEVIEKAELNTTDEPAPVKKSLIPAAPVPVAIALVAVLALVQRRRRA